jgi:mutator protein MutT
MLVFLAKRGKAARNERYKWEFPGGSVEFGENLEDAVVREVKEEYDFDISVEQLLDVVNHFIPDERQHWISPTYLCKYTGGSPRIMEPDKCEDIGWFNLDSIPEAELTIASMKSLKSLKLYLIKTKKRWG